MKRIGKYNRAYNKQLRISMYIIVTIILTTLLIFFPRYINHLMDLIKEESIITLQSVSAQNATIVRNTLESRQRAMKSLARQIEAEGAYNIPDIIAKLKLYVDEYRVYLETDSMYNMGIIDKSGICYTTRNEKMDLSQYDYFIDGMKGISRITESYLSEDGKEMLNIFTMPIYKEGEVEMILTSAYKSSDFAKLLEIESFEGYGRSIVLDASGELIAAISNSEGSSLEEGQQVETDILSVAKNISEVIQKADEGSGEFNCKGRKYIGYYEPVGMNDWYIISYAPEDYIYRNLDIIKVGIFQGSAVIYLACLIFLVFEIYSSIKYREKITKLIFFDELTGEKNYEHLKIYFEGMSRKDKKEKTLILMDIDKFKSINIIYGSDMGDRILKYIPSIYKELLPNDKLFKYQADVFIAIVNNTLEEEIVEKINKIQMKIKEDIEKGVIIPIKLNFGVCALDEFEDLHSIYTNAVIAKNEIKKSVNKNIKFFNSMDKLKIVQNQKIEFEFLEALKNKEFEIWYQPKYNMTTGQIYGAEALVRWHKKDGSFVQPSNFIPVLENTGQIIQLDEAVIEMVFQDIQEMKHLGMAIKPISINLSRVQVANFGLINKIKELMKEHKVDSSNISFEITESALIENNDAINNIVSQLHKIGFKVDIDDYGVGSSTLNAIFALDFDTFKLDKTFCDHIGTAKMDTIIKATIKMANELNMTVIAEGVETKEQIDFLIENNCYIAQGYYYSKPINKTEYFKLIERNN